MQLTARKSEISISTNIEKTQISHVTLPRCRIRCIAPVLRLAYVVLLASLPFVPLSIYGQASAATVTNIFSGNTDLSFFGGDGTDEFQVTYTFDTDSAPQGATVGNARYGPVTGNIRADNIGPGGLSLDFNSGNASNSLLIVSDNATMFPSGDTVDIFAISFATTSNILFGGELIRGFALSLIDEQASIFSSPALEGGTGFFAGIDAINLRFHDPLFFGPDGFPIPATSSGPGLLVVQRNGASLTGVSAVPLPATLPLIAGGLGFLSLLGWRGKRKTSASRRRSSSNACAASSPLGAH